MPEAATATMPVEQQLITDAGESYNLPGAEAISTYTAATCAKLVDELVKNGLLVEPAEGAEAIAGFSKLSLSSRREALIKVVNNLQNNEAKEAAEDQKAGNVVENYIKDHVPHAPAAAPAVAPNASPAPAAETEAPLKEKKKPGPKPGSKKKPAATVTAATNQPASPPIVSGDQDPIIKLASKIEKIKTRGELEGQIRDVVDEGAQDEFSLGGLLAKAQSTPEWWNTQYESFRDYIEAVVGVKYRKAMNCIEIYLALLKMDRPWGVFGDIGWTKVLALTKILKKDTPDDEFQKWITDAKLLTVEGLKAKIEAALKPEGEQKPDAESEIKSMTFRLHADQREVVDAALEVAMKAVSTDVKAVGLEAIAQSYMGTGLAFKNWKEAMSYARKHTDDPLTFASTVIEALEGMCPELEWPEIPLDIRSEPKTEAAE